MGNTQEKDLKQTEKSKTTIGEKIIESNLVSANKVDSKQDVQLNTDKAIPADRTENSGDLLNKNKGNLKNTEEEHKPIVEEKNQTVTFGKNTEKVKLDANIDNTSSSKTTEIVQKKTVHEENSNTNLTSEIEPVEKKTSCSKQVEQEVITEKQPVLELQESAKPLESLNRVTETIVYSPEVKVEIPEVKERQNAIVGEEIVEKKTQAEANIEIESKRDKPENVTPVQIQIHTTEDVPMENVVHAPIHELSDMVNELEEFNYAPHHSYKDTETCTQNEATEEPVTCTQTETTPESPICTQTEDVQETITCIKSENLTEVINSTLIQTKDQSSESTPEEPTTQIETDQNHE